MRQELVLLKELQALDKQYRELEMARKRHPQTIAQIRQELDAKHAQLEKQKKATIELQKAVDTKYLRLREIEDKIKELETKLNTVKTNKEYSAILSQKGAEEADKSRLEDEILMMMGQVEDAKKELQQAIEKFEQEKKATEEAIRKAEENQASAAAQMAQLKAQREKLKAQIPAQWIEPYERLLNKRDGVALTMAVRHVPKSRAADSSEVWICQGCYMNLTTQTIASLLTSDKPVFCNSCGRMLYLEGTPEFAASKGKS